MRTRKVETRNIGVSVGGGVITDDGVGNGGRSGTQKPNTFAAVKTPVG